MPSPQPTGTVAITESTTGAAGETDVNGPGTLTENEVLVAVIKTTNMVDNLTAAPTNWTIVEEKLNITAAGSTWVYWHRVTAAEAASPPASYRFTMNVARPFSAQVVRLTGAITSGDPFDPTPSILENGTAGTTPRTPTVQPYRAGM